MSQTKQSKKSGKTKSKENSDVEFSTTGFKAKNVNTTKIILLILGLALVTFLLTFKYSSTTEADGSTSTEIQLRKSNP